MSHSGEYIFSAFQTINELENEEDADGLGDLDHRGTFDDSALTLADRGRIVQGVKLHVAKSGMFKDTSHWRLFLQLESNPCFPTSVELNCVVLDGFGNTRLVVKSNTYSEPTRNSTFLGSTYCSLKREWRVTVQMVLDSLFNHRFHKYRLDMTSNTGPTGCFYWCSCVLLHFERSGWLVPVENGIWNNVYRYKANMASIFPNNIRADTGRGVFYGRHGN